MTHRCELALGTSPGSLRFLPESICRLLLCLALLGSIGVPVAAQEERGAWLGGAVATRVLLTGFELRVGVADLVWGRDVRFDGAYLPYDPFYMPTPGAPPRPVPLDFEFGASVLFATPRPLPDEVFGVIGYAGMGPRLLALVGRGTFTVGFGGLVGLEGLARPVGLFLEADATFYGLGVVEGRPRLTAVPFPKVAVGINYYF